MGDRRGADRHRRRGAQGALLPGPDHRHQQGDPRVATETDAARDRVLAARASLGEELATARGLRPLRDRHPRQDQAQPGQGRRRRRRRRRSSRWAARSACSAAASARSRASRSPLPTSMLPKEIDKTLRALGRRRRRRCAARSSAISRPTPSRRGQGPSRTADPHRPDRRPAAPVRWRQGRRGLAVQPRRGRASRRDSPRSANGRSAASAAARRDRSRGRRRRPRRTRPAGREPPSRPPTRPMRGSAGA